jgi:transposase
MPVRSFSREKQWLLPPRLDELIPPDHPARFVAAFVDELDYATWASLQISRSGEKEGAPAYNPVLLLSAWLYGFMTKVRSSRRLEAACREQLPFIWLTGNQKPDHNTLWRFYKENRQGMRRLLKRTVETALAAGLVDLALQAVDGTKIAANASPSRTYDKAGLAKLLERVEAAIKDLEAQNATGGDQLPRQLPKELHTAEALRDKVREALSSLAADEHHNYTNLSDEDAALLRTRGGFVTGYNAQTMASPLSLPEGEVGGRLITAVAVVNELDVGQLLPMIAEAEANTGRNETTTLADAGYHSGPNLVACEEQSRSVLMPEGQAKALGSPYHKDAFKYDAEADIYTCPEGKTLRFRDTRQRDGRPVRRYRAAASVCRSCPVFGICTRDARHGRALEIGPEDEALRQHRARMATPEGKEAYRKRKSLIEPVFGIIKEHLGVWRFLLRGLSNVAAEWSLVATAFNLRVLAGAWRRGLLTLVN